jgi:ElaB/YqjD/DUF883 family membrane-anchored ribosome-binding protein
VLKGLSMDIPSQLLRTEDDLASTKGTVSQSTQQGDNTALRVDVVDDNLILNGSFPCRPAAEYLSRHPAPERVRLFGRAVEIGVFCLERTTSSQDLEFIRRHADRVMHDVAAVVGTIPKAISSELVQVIGTRDGQVLAPVVQLIDTTAKVAERSISDARRLLQDVDPGRSDGTVGRALKTVRDLLDPQRRDSVPSRIDEAVRSLGDRGGSFATVLRSTIDEALAPVRAELRTLADRLVAHDAAAEVVGRTTEKGFPYELEVLRRVHIWGKAVGATVDHVGGDHQPGDILVRFGSDSLFGRELILVIEARDRSDSRGLKRVADDLEAAMRQRNGSAALYVGRTSAAFAKEIGDWIDGRSLSGPYVACVDGLLEAALRYVVALVRLDDSKQTGREIDAAAIHPHIAQVRTAVERTRSMKTKLTAIDTATIDVRREIDTLRAEIGNAVDGIEGVLKKAAPTSSAAHPATAAVGDPAGRAASAERLPRRK